MSGFTCQVLQVTFFDKVVELGSCLGVRYQRDPPSLVSVFKSSLRTELQLLEKAARAMIVYDIQNFFF